MVEIGQTGLANVIPAGSIAPARTGWLCPKCGGAHAPHIDNCPQGFGLQPYPYPPYFYQPVSPCTVTCGGIATNATLEAHGC